MREQLVVAGIAPYPLEEHGGVARNLLEGANYLEREGIHVVPIGPSKRGVRRNPQVVHFGRSLFEVPHDDTRTEFLVARERTAQRIFNEIKPDIVHVHEPAAALGPTGRGQLLPLLLTAPRREDGQTIPTFGATLHARLDRDKRWLHLTNFAVRHLMVVATRRYIPAEFHRGLLNYLHEHFGNHLLAVSEATRTFWQDLLPWGYEIIYNGIDTALYTPEGPWVEKWVNGKKTILMAGRHDKRKGFDIGIQAYALLRQQRDDVQLKIAGVGERTEELRRFVEIHALPDVEFTGRLNQGDLARAYRTADVFVSPATGGEGFGRVLVEAMACGTPVVASDIPGYTEALQEQSFTRRVEPGNVEGFAQAIVQFIDLPVETRRVWQEEAHHYVDQNFSWTIIAPKQADTYRRWVLDHGYTPKSEWPQRKQRRFSMLRFPRRGSIFNQ